MSNAIPSRIGQVNGAGDTLATFLKVFSGEILTTFNREAYFRGKQVMRTIPSGKSAQFPATGITTAYTHTPGDEILGQKINGAETTISIEGLLLAPVFISNIDEAMAHFDVRSIYATDIAQALLKQYDGDVSRVIANAARLTTPLVNGVFAGDTITRLAANAQYATDGLVIGGGIYDAHVLMDERDVPMSDRYSALRPVQYALLTKSNYATDTRYNGERGDLGGVAQGTTKEIYGVRVDKTNNLARTADGADLSRPASRRHDYSVTQGLVWHKSAAGTVALQDVTTESEYDMRRQGWLTLGKYLCGHGTLRPEAAEELRSGAPAN
ncbi:MAG: hypothetical protein WA154_12940 [Moraxellaceae bacterium]